jgi:hypothetical protein
MLYICNSNNNKNNLIKNKADNCNEQSLIESPNSQLSSLYLTLLALQRLQE